MQPGKKHWIFPFVFVVAGNLIGNAIGSEWMIYLTKPFLLIWIILYFQINIKTRFNTFAKLILGGFIFSWLGDMLLMFQHISGSFFLAGLVAFLITHVFYGIAFRFGVKKLSMDKMLYSILFLAFATGFYIYILPYLGEMKIPVALYTAVISFMVMMSINRARIPYKTAYTLIVAGALLFTASDLVLAFNKFVLEFHPASVINMGLYIAGQLLIMSGSIRAVD
jgi:uncharacterized membrane protein YhhN